MNVTNLDIKHVQCWNPNSSFRSDICQEITSLSHPVHHYTVPVAGAASVALVGLVALAGSLLSAAGPPSVPGALRINLEVSEDMPVTAQPVQPEEAPAG